MMRVNQLRVLALLLSVLLATSCVMIPHNDSDCDPAFPAAASVRDLNKMGDLRADFLWRHASKVGVLSAPVVAGCVVYIAGDSHVYALDAASGNPLWSYEIDEEWPAELAAADGMVYVGTHDGKVYALDAVSGRLLWLYGTGAWTYAPAVADGVVYVSTHNSVHALSGASGELYWRSWASWVDSPPAGGRRHRLRCHR